MSEIPGGVTERTARSLVRSTEPYLSCEECLHLTDQYVDALAASDTTADWTVLEVHLAGCGACADEVESLHALVVADAVQRGAGGAR